jgi:hypothetical protein
LSRLLVLEIISKRLALNFFNCNRAHCGWRQLWKIGADLGKVSFRFLISRPAELHKLRRLRCIWFEVSAENKTFYYILKSGTA